MVISEKTAPVKGEKVSLKIHRADLRGREICPTGRLFFYMSAILFPFPLTASVGSDGGKV